MISRRYFCALALFLATLPAAAEPAVFIVRHAEKETTDAAAKDPDLSPAGRERAASLARMLREVGVAAIFATEYKRTQQTAEPISRATNVAVTVVAAKDTTALLEKLNATNGNALVIGHSNTLPEILKAMGIPGEISIADHEYDNLFIWNRSAAREVIRLRY